MKQTVNVPKVVHLCDVCKKKRTQIKCPECKKDICKDCGISFMDAIVCKTHFPNIGLTPKNYQEMYEHAYLSDSGFWKLKHATLKSWVVITTREDSVLVDVCESKAKAEEVIKDLYDSELNNNDTIYIYHDGKTFSYRLRVEIY